MAINIEQDIVSADKPDVLKGERIYVYVPKATNDQAGIVSFSDDYFFVDNNSKVHIRLTDPFEQESLIKLNNVDFLKNEQGKIDINWVYAHDPVSPNRTNGYGLIKIAGDSAGYLRFNSGLLEVDYDKVVEQLKDDVDLTPLENRVTNLETTTSEHTTQINGLIASVNGINLLIPSEASSINKLASEGFVLDTVSKNAASFRGNWSTWNAVPSDAEDYPIDSYGNKEPNENDYLVLQDTSTYGDGSRVGSWRFKYSGDWVTNGKNGWQPEFQINEEPLTNEQLAALNSGITSQLVSAYNGYATSIFDLGSSLSSLGDRVGMNEGNISLLQTDVSGLSSDLNSEITNRQNADNTLSGNISSLQTTVSGHTTSISNLETAVSTNANNISGEITNRQNADTSLQNQINQHTTDISTLQTTKANVSDLVVYELKTNKVTNLSNPSNDTYPTTLLLNTELGYKVDKVTGKGLSTNDYTTAEKNKLSGIESGAQVNVIEVVKVNGTALAVSEKAVNVVVPTKTSDITNDSGYITNSVSNLVNYYTKTEIDGKISSVYKPAGSVAFANLPTLSASVLGNVYNVTDAFTTTSDFVEGTGKSYPAGTNVVVVDISSTSTPDYKFDVMSGFVDLSGYVQTTRKINNKPLSSDITLTASDVGALPSDTTYVSSVNGSSGALTGIQTTGNLVTSFSSTTSDSKYPSEKLVKTELDKKQDALTAGNNITISTVNNVLTISATDTTYSSLTAADGGTDVSLVTTGEKYIWNNKQNALTFDNSPTENSNNPVKSGGIYTALSGKVDVVSGKGLSTNDYTTAEKNKLSGIEAGAQVNVIETVKVNGSALTPSSKVVDITVPTKTSDLNNDSGFITKSVNDLTYYYTKTETNALISAVYKPAGSVTFSNLPTLSASVLGNVYNVTDSFTTTSDFVEGAGNTYPAGTNVAVVDVGTSNSPSYKFDVLSGFVDLSGYQVKFTDGSATIASVSSDIVTLKAGVSQNGGAIGNSSGSDIVLAKVAKTGSYNDLSNKPTLGTAAALNTGTSNGNIPVIGSNGKLDSSIIPAIITVDSALSSTSENPVQNKVINSALLDKQDLITNSNKLSADLVQDSTSRILVKQMDAEDQYLKDLGGGLYRIGIGGTLFYTTNDDDVSVWASDLLLIDAEDEDRHWTVIGSGRMMWGDANDDGTGTYNEALLSNINKAVRYDTASQGLTSTQQENARTNINAQQKSKIDNYMQIGFTYDREITTTTDFDIFYGYENQCSNGDAFTISGDDRCVVIGSGVSAIKVTFVLVLQQNSSLSRFSAVIKKNGSDIPTSHASSYIWQTANMGGGANLTMTQTIIFDVAQGDKIKFYARSRENTGTTKDRFLAQSHILLEVKR